MTYVMNKDYGNSESRSYAFTRALCPRVQMCVKDVLNATDPQSATTFVFCDFGASYGLATSLLLSAVASEVERAGGPKEISVVLEDQEENDFRPAFGHFHQPMMKEGLPAPTNVLVSAVGKSFYEQCVPSDSLHFATSVYAAQYLDTSRPLEGRQTGFSLPLLRRWRQVRHDLSTLTEAERAQLNALSEKAAADWERFLLCRAKELRVGGQMMIAALANVPQDMADFPRLSDGVVSTIDDDFGLIADAVHELVEKGVIGEDEEENFLGPAYYRTLEEVKAPFVEDDSPVRKAGLRLRHAEYVIAEHP